MKVTRTCEFTEENFNEVMHKVLNHSKITTHDYVEFYSSCVLYCQMESPDTDCGNGQIIYERLQKLLRGFVAEKAKQIAAAVEDEDRLRLYRAAWEKFAFSSGVTNNLFRYVNVHWVNVMNDRSYQDCKPVAYFDVYKLCLVTWKEEMFEKSGLNIPRSALNLINRHRDGESGADEILVKALTDSLEKLGKEYERTDELFPRLAGTEDQNNGELSAEAMEKLQTYEKLFEEPMLEDTRRYYALESATVIEDGDIFAYMRKTEERLTEEAERSRRCLKDELTSKRLQRAVESAYIEERLELFQNEFRNLLVAERIADLQRMWRLCSRVERAMQRLHEEFRDYVAEKGREAIANIPSSEQNDPKIYVQTALKTYERFLQLTEVAFSNDAGFAEFFEKGCALMINENAVTKGAKAPGKTSEMLARFVDAMMKKGAGEDFERSADQTMTFFKFIEDKDVFQKYYNRFLAKRLLMSLSLSEDAESSLISRLKTACGHQFTATAHKMMQDMKVSKDLSEKFKTKQEESPKKQEKSAKSLQIDANFQILNSGCWPCGQSPSFVIPAALQERMTAFSAFYAEIHQGRKLTTLLSASRGELTTKCFASNYTFSATTAQMTVLLKYNENTVFSVTQLQEESTMPAELLQSVLASFVKVNLLKKTESGEYALNAKFTSKRMKLDLQKLQMTKRDGGEAARKEQQVLEKSLDEDRKVVIQAAIVRIMKMRRRLQHNALIAEIVEQVSARFQPRIPMIKKCIDLLMEKQYVERSQESRDVYEYIS